MIRSNFDFVDKPWWHQDYDDRNVQYIISNTKRLQNSISLVVDSEDELYWKVYIEYHRERYLIECISAKEVVV